MIHLSSNKSEERIIVYLILTFFPLHCSKKEELNRTPSPKLPVGSVHIIDSLFIIMGYLFTQSHKYLEDYR